MNRHLRYIGRLLFLSFILVITISGCQRGGSHDLPDVRIDLKVLPTPPQIGPAILTLIVSDDKGQPIPGAKIELEGNMNHAGMAPVFVQAAEVGPGQYEVPFQFTMGGDWFILVRATLPDGRKLERQLNVPGVTAQ